MKMKTFSLAGVSLAALVASTALAQAVTASAVADLNLRAGPGSEFQILGLISAGESVDVSGCLASQEWCEISGGAGEGWAYAPYLMFEDEGTPQPLSQVSTRTVTIIEDTSARDEATLIGTGMGAVAGAIIAGPIGAVVGGLASGMTMNNAVDSETTVYVQQNPVQPVFLSGEAVVGASIPADVVVYDVPSTQQVTYLNVNGDTVLVDRESRRIIQVVR
ncbi:MAG: DUF1236 domain-containing protein [Pararhodobacter sp.]